MIMMTYLIFKNYIQHRDFCMSAEMKYKWCQLTAVL